MRYAILHVQLYHSILFWFFNRPAYDYAKIVMTNKIAYVEKKTNTYTSATLIRIDIAYLSQGSVCVSVHMVSVCQKEKE